MIVRVIGVDGDSAAKRVEGLFGAALRDQRRAEHRLGGREFGMDGDDLAAHRFRLGDIAAIVMRVGEIDGELRIPRPLRRRPLEKRNRQIGRAVGDMKSRQIVQRADVGFVRREGPAICLFGILGTFQGGEFQAQTKGERRVAWVGVERPRQQAGRFRLAAGPRQFVGGPGHRVRVSEIDPNH